MPRASFPEIGRTGARHLWRRCASISGAGCSSWLRAIASGSLPAVAHWDAAFRTRHRPPFADREILGALMRCLEMSESSQKRIEALDGADELRILMPHGVTLAAQALAGLLEVGEGAPPPRSGATTPVPVAPARSTSAVTVHRAWPRPRKRAAEEFRGPSEPSRPNLG